MQEKNRCRCPIVSGILGGCVQRVTGTQTLKEKETHAVPRVFRREAIRENSKKARDGIKCSNNIW